MGFKKESSKLPEKEHMDDTILLDYFPFRDSKFMKIAVPIIILWFLMLCALILHLSIYNHDIWPFVFVLLFAISYTIVILAYSRYRICIFSDKIIRFSILRKTTVAKPNRAAIEIKYGYRGFVCNFLDIEHNEKIILTSKFGEISPIKEKRILLEINGYAIYDSENILKRY